MAATRYGGDNSENEYPMRKVPFVDVLLPPESCCRDSDFDDVAKTMKTGSKKVPFAIFYVHRHSFNAQLALLLQYLFNGNIACQ
jgi:hypothetical protein